MSAENRLKELLESISQNEKYKDCVFHAPGFYFVILNGTIWEMTDNSDGYYPEIVSGPTIEEAECLLSMMESIGFEKDFFHEMIEDCIEFSDEDALEYFEDNGDDESARIYKKIRKMVKSGKTPFESMDHFVGALGRYDLNPCALYYEWDGEYIDLYENVCEAGDRRGEHENLDDEAWINILENLDTHMVTA
jgi:hypothetical protein